MNILVIGGTGFISGNLVKLLLEAGHRVTIFNRGKTAVPFEPSGSLFVEKGDRRVESSLRELVRRQVFDAVFDMIAYEPQESRLAAQVFRGKVGRFIHCSSVSVYMVSDQIQCPVTEDQDTLPLMEPWPRNPFGMDYGLKKRQCEEVLMASHHPLEFPVTMLRPTYVSGPGDPTRRDFFWIERILDGKPILVPGSGDFAFQLVFVLDAARAFLLALERASSSGRAYNVAGTEIFSLNEYLDVLGDLLGRTPELVHVDQHVFDKQTFSSRPGGDMFPFNVRRTAVFSLDRAKNELGFQSTPFRRWMEETINWYRANMSDHSLGYELRSQEVLFAEKWERIRRQLRMSGTNGKDTGLDISR